MLAVIMRCEANGCGESQEIPLQSLSEPSFELPKGWYGVYNTSVGDVQISPNKSTKIEHHYCSLNHAMKGVGTIFDQSGS